MAAAYDGEAVTVGAYSGASSVTLSNHTTAGSDRCAVLCLPFVVAGSEPSAVTYGGSAMTNQVTKYNASMDARATIYTFLNPPTAATNCAVTFAAGAYGYAGVLSANGVHQTTPVAVGHTATAEVLATGNSISATCTTAADELLIDCVKWYSGQEPTALDAGANQTNRFEGEDGSFNENGCGSTQAGSDGGVMSWALATDTFGGSEGAVQAVISLAAAAGGAADPEGSLLAGKLLRGGLLLHGVLGR